MAIKADDRLIVALDFHTMEDVKSLVEKLGESVSYYKVGMELFYSVGGEVVRWLRGQGKHVFLDLKLHDIPNTVAGGLCSLMDLGADILNVHASGGYTMMKTAARRSRGTGDFLPEAHRHHGADEHQPGRLGGRRPDPSHQGRRRTPRKASQVGRP